MAHEIGHFPQIEDACRDRLAPGWVSEAQTSIMHSTVTGEVYPHHLQGLADWVSRRAGVRYEETLAH